MRKFFFDCGTRDSVASLGILVFRCIFAGMMFWGHGWAKLQDFANVSKHLYVNVAPLNYLSSEVHVGLCLLGELIAPILIVLGFATRPAAFVLGFTMVVAAFYVHGQDPIFLGSVPGAAKEPALLYLAAMVGLILTGSGSFSLDALMYWQGKGRRY